MKLKHFFLFLVLSALVATAASPDAGAEGKLREMLQKRRAQQAEGGEKKGGMFDENSLGRGKMSCKEKVAQLEKFKGAMQRMSKDKPPVSLSASYGKHVLQAIDVYTPKDAKNAAPYPIIFMVHGGGWCLGDKGHSGVIVNKLNRWGPKGFIVVSANYRMITDGVYPLEQAQDVADALAYVQKHAAEWQGDPEKIIIMGHSAGAHIVSLLNADVEKTAARGVTPWLGTVSLDTAAMNIPKKMKGEPAYLYQEAFGKDEKYWEDTSPFHKVSAASPPWLGVCSSKRKDSCPDGELYAEKSRKLGLRAETLPEPVGHGAINKNLGEPGDYTDAVEKFMGSLDAEVKKRLQ